MDRTNLRGDSSAGKVQYEKPIPTGYVYALADVALGQIVYVGQTTNQHLETYVRTKADRSRRSDAPCHAFNSWIAQAEIKIIVLATPEFDQLRDLERMWIQCLLALGSPLLNRNGRGKGGLLDQGYRPSLESNASRSAKLKGRKQVRYTAKEKERGHIYALVDPLTRDIRYIGQTGHVIQRRFYGHIWTAQNKPASSPAASWVAEVLSRGDEPMLEIVERPLKADLFKRETYWRRYMLDTGCDLLNREYVPTAGTPGAMAAGNALRGKKRPGLASYETALSRGTFILNTPENRQKANDKKRENAKILISCTRCRKLCRGEGSFKYHVTRYHFVSDSL